MARVAKQGDKIVGTNDVVLADAPDGSQTMGREITKDEAYTFSGQILGKIPRAYVEAHTSHLVDAFNCEQAYLTMSTAIGVGIVDKAIVFFEKPFGYIFLSSPLLLAFTDRNYFRHAITSPV